MPQNVRQSTDTCSYYGVPYASDADSALDYLDSIDKRDRTILEDALIARYAVRRATRTDESGTVEDYERADARDAITKGRVEIVTTHTYRRIVHALATLFTQRTQSWRYGEDGEDEETAELIGEQRDKGLFRRTLVRADRIACALGSSVVLVSWRGGNLRYQAVPPQCVRFLFGTEIADENETRDVDLLEIEDASAVVLDLGSVTQNQVSSWGVYSGGQVKHRFLAYVGRSDQYQRGRCVTYISSDWSTIPDFGGADAKDLVDGEGPYNPLTVANGEDPENYPYEYPITILYGSDSGADETLLPLTGLALYSDAVELDMEYSRLVQCATKSARGVFAVSNEMGEKLPSNPDEGIVLLKRGQTLSVMGQDASNASNALEVIRATHRAIAESWHVPSHEVVEDRTLPESGIAIALRSQDKIEHRRERYELNRSGVERLWQIERSLLSIAPDSPAQIDADVKQSWDCGQWVPPTTGAEIVAEIAAAKAAGLIDNVEAVRRYYGLATASEAQELLEQIAERKAESGEAAAEEQQRQDKLAALQSPRQFGARREPGARRAARMASEDNQDGQERAS